jgi:hypothetical protein
VREGAPVGRRIDASRQTAHDAEAAAGQARCEASCGIHRYRRGRARTDDGHHGRVEGREIAATPQHWWAIRYGREQCWEPRIVPGQRIDTSLFRATTNLAGIVDARSGEFAELGIRAQEARGQAGFAKLVIEQGPVDSGGLTGSPEKTTGRGPGGQNAT